VTQGRTIRNDKKGHIVHQQQPIPQLLSSSTEESLTLTTEVEKKRCYAVGAQQMKSSFNRYIGHRRVQWMNKAKTLLRLVTTHLFITKKGTVVPINLINGCYSHQINGGQIFTS
jgi:hypothetical protein